MKKCVFVAVMVLTVTVAFGQKNVRQSASNYLKEGKLDKALDAINQCIVDPSTAQDAKSWYIRANIFLGVANSKDGAYKNLNPDPINAAIESFAKAVEFDTKKELYEDIFTKIDELRFFYFNSAVQNYNNGKYVDAAKDFVRSADVISVVNVLDTTSLLNGALSATKGNDYVYAKSIYLRLIKARVNMPSVYSSISDIYRTEKNMDSALLMVRKGEELFPGNFQLFLTETNIYLSSNETDKALQNLKVAIEKDPANPTIYMVLGNIYDRISQDTTIAIGESDAAFEEAIKGYQKAIELKPDYFDAVYNIGAMYVNKAAIILNEANKLPLDAIAEFDKLAKVAEDYLDKAIPNLEKASSLQPNDLNTLYSLKQIYARKKMNDKVKEINAKIDALQGK